MILLVLRRAAYTVKACTVRLTQWVLDLVALTMGERHSYNQVHYQLKVMKVPISFGVGCGVFFFCFFFLLVHRQEPWWSWLLVGLKFVFQNVTGHRYSMACSSDCFFASPNVLFGVLSTWMAQYFHIGGLLYKFPKCLSISTSFFFFALRCSWSVEHYWTQTSIILSMLYSGNRTGSDTHTQSLQ